MDVKEAIAKAKMFMTNVFAGEDVSDIRLEEVEYDPEEDAWHITLGLMRPTFSLRIGQLSGAMGPLGRTYKVVKVPNNENEVPSIKIRELADG